MITFRPPYPSRTIFNVQKAIMKFVTSSTARITPSTTTCQRDTVTLPFYFYSFLFYCSSRFQSLWVLFLRFEVYMCFEFEPNLIGEWTNYSRQFVGVDYYHWKAQAQIDSSFNRPQNQCFVVHQVRLDRLCAQPLAIHIKRYWLCVVCVSTISSSAT